MRRRLMAPLAEIAMRYCATCRRSDERMPKATRGYRGISAPRSDCPRQGGTGPAVILHKPPWLAGRPPPRKAGCAMTVCVGSPANYSPSISFIRFLLPLCRALLHQALSRFLLNIFLGVHCLAHGWLSSDWRE